MSDHRTIEFEVKLGEEVDTTEAAGLWNRKCNWELFVSAMLEQGEGLRSATEGITKDENAEMAAEMLNNTVIKACAKSMPKRKGSRNQSHGGRRNLQRPGRK